LAEFGELAVAPAILGMHLPAEPGMSLDQCFWQTQSRLPNCK
jgi:hypothetical protein